MLWIFAARRGVSGARYQTGLVIDLNGPAGNIFYLMGVCNRLVRELGFVGTTKTRIRNGNQLCGRLSLPPDHHAKMVLDCVYEVSNIA